VAKVDQVYATRFRRKFGVEDELNRYVAALYEMLGSVLGQPQMIHVDLTRVVLVVAVVNAVLALPALRLVSWALPAASTEGVPTSTASTGILR